ncbi:hypothetical protein PFICI_08090 [Pestalotiopsis fici W106-1]|uniref:N-acetyltransferase domain-containing protein n=1 Tax=Pestalotiopsis fici (strain W106-1 / CGMCC3.15140) TaxID=1229662 RepID=W3X5V5_PESFW|nr:uncharacterized protein PFICI_08090 [Pestalotiopsis fici W106-1]ETS80561.1 hypothetical protein PFICI_08090 [Pestalotiopsis fici W106-1]
MAPDLVHRAASYPRSEKVLLKRDLQSCIPLMNVLNEGDLLVLLSPVVAPLAQDDVVLDPFEPLGRALAARHAWVRHVPYTANRGITEFHSTFIKRAKVIIFVIAGAAVPGQVSQIDMAELAQVMAEYRPLVVVACQEEYLGFEENHFGTIIQLSGYAPSQLEEAAAVLFGETPATIDRPLGLQEPTAAPKKWTVEALPDSLIQFDVSPILDLWNECLPKQFTFNRYTLQSLLDRDGFGRHYVVRQPETREIIGFCATYTTWAFSDPDFLVGSVAILLVKNTYRKMGIGSSLYNHATGLLTRTRGVERLQLGSTFPRLLCGIPQELSPSRDWFKKRGWDLDSREPGGGKEVCDWLLKIHDWPSGGLGSIPEGYTFRTCTPDDFSNLLDFLRREESRNETMGLFEIYKWSKDSTFDIVLSLHGQTIVAAALTYMPDSGSTADTEIPWPRTMGPLVGGITCICISEDNPAVQRYRNSVMIRLLGTCIEQLSSYGMQEVFLDGMRSGGRGFEDLGFRKWATYQEVWKPVGNARP